MRLMPELLQVEGTGIAPDLVAQLGKAREVDALGPEQEPVRPFVQLQPVTRTDTHGIQHRRGKGNLALGRDLDYHNVLVSLR